MTSPHHNPVYKTEGIIVIPQVNSAQFRLKISCFGFKSQAARASSEVLSAGDNTCIQPGFVLLSYSFF